MSLFNKILFLFLGIGISLGSKSSLQAQDCSFAVSGYVIDGETKTPMEAVTVIWLPDHRGMMTDQNGHFRLKGCKEGELVLSYLGYETLRCSLHLQSDTNLRLTLMPSAIQILPIEVEELAVPDQVSAERAVDDAAIVEQTGQPLAAMLDGVAGVSQLQNGNHIAKPVVQGLYGNRLTLLNNGVAQSGQQWGNDHGPAIDPLGASTLRLIQGAASVQYPSSNLGSVVLVEPSAIGDASAWHAKGTYTLMTNGWGHGLHLAAQQATKGWGWRVNGTFQRGGDQRTPHYWLRNTGQQLIAGALQVERQWSDRLFADLYASTYNAQLGVLRGSHVGNLTDLSAAFARHEPFFTRSYFSYGLEAPRQEVHHHLLKVRLRHQLSDKQQLTYQLAAQLNDRQEFDVRRGGRTQRPALSLFQMTYDAGITYQQEWERGFSLTLGAQANLIDNTNQPETGILPLIPDHRSWRTGVFGLLVQQWKRSRWELGARYDYWNQSVAAISTDLPRRIVRYQNHWHAGNVTLGWTQRLNRAWRLWATASYASRPPAINELYSQGLHQGVSGIEEGDPDLMPEQVGQGQVGVSAQVLDWLGLELLGYGQWYQNYIYLAPQSEVQLTIRGAFPVFRYEQTQARILGADATIVLDDHKHWSYKGTYSYLRGDDLAHQCPLVFLPPNRWHQELTYSVSPNQAWGKTAVKNCSISLNHRYQWEQYHLAANQDFLAPPVGYHLIGGRVQVSGETGRTAWRFWCRVDNALNTTYRDYLNRQRYFADALGTQVTLGAHVLLRPKTTT